MSSPEAKFKIGDTDRLKSGGPVMTVVAVGPLRSGEPRFIRKWFASDTEEPLTSRSHPDLLMRH